MTGVDAHTHLAEGRFDPAVLAQGDALGIETFLCSHLGDFQPYPTIDEIRELNRVLADRMREFPGRVLGYCYVNPRHGADALDDLRRNVEDRGMVGMKLWIASTADDPAADDVLRYAAEQRLIVLAHAWRKTVGQFDHESTAEHVARAAGRHPDARFVMAHLGGQVESAVNTVQDLPNVLVDTSGTIIGAGEVALAVDRLGVDRVVFGSDTPIACLAEAVGKVLAADLAPADEERVFGGTLTRLLAEVGA